MCRQQRGMALRWAIIKNRWDIMKVFPEEMKDNQKRGFTTASIDEDTIYGGAGVFRDLIHFDVEMKISRRDAHIKPVSMFGFEREPLPH